MGRRLAPVVTAHDLIAASIAESNAKTMLTIFCVQVCLHTVGPRGPPAIQLVYMRLLVLALPRLIAASEDI
jgi:hypothetical protein